MISFTNLKILEEKLIKSIMAKRRNNRWKAKAKKFLGKEKVLTSSQKKEATEFYKDHAKIDMVFQELHSGQFALLQNRSFFQ